MKVRAAAIIALVACTLAGASALAQDLGPQVRKLADGVYVHTGKGYDSNSGIILTEEGVIIVDTGQNAIESRSIMATVRKLTQLPVLMVINTEPHRDHTTGLFVFSPPAVVVAAAGAGDSMRAVDRAEPDRIRQQSAISPEMKAALEGYRFVTPTLEYQQRTTVSMGGRTLELFYMKGEHSEADTAVWLPRERILFSASAFVNNQINIFRPIVNIADILAAGKMMKSLNPEQVIPGHGAPGTVRIFEDGEKYYALLLEKVGKAMKSGKTLDEMKKEITMPEYASWGSHERMPTNVDAAYRMLSGK